jgi:hypothetical protein
MAQVEEGDADNVRAGDMGVLATLGSFAAWKENGKLVHLAFYRGTPGTSSLKKGAAGALEPSHREGR